MGTQFDPDYARATKTILFDLCRSAPNTRILDIGTGDGQLWQFAPDAADWYAIDISHTGVRRAINRFPKLSGAVASCERLPFPERFFGAVIAADTLEHTFDLQQSLASIRRVLADDGIFCFSVPAPNSLRKWGYNKLLRGSPSPAFLLKLLLVVLRRTVLFGRPDFQPIDRDLSLREWRTLIEGAGFQIVQTRLWPSAPYTPIVRLVAARTVA
jgi:SAM-dependent methyltransferase